MAEFRKNNWITYLYIIFFLNNLYLKMLCVFFKVEIQRVFFYDRNAE